MKGPESELTVHRENVYPTAYEDEVSLVDLWLVLARRKWVVFGTTALVLLAAIGWALLKPKTYEYRTSIEIGTTIRESGDGVETVLVDDPRTVLAKLNESFIPLILSEYRHKHPDDEEKELAAKIPKGSEIVVVAGEGLETAENEYKTLLQQVTEQLVRDHTRLMDVNRGRLEAKLVEEKLRLDELTDPGTLKEKKKELEATLTAANVYLEELKDPTTLGASKARIEAELQERRGEANTLRAQGTQLEVKLKQLDEFERLLTGQIDSLRKDIREATAQHADIARQAKDENSAVMLLMLNDTLQEQRSRLTELEEKLYIDLEEKRRETLRELDMAKNRRAVFEKMAAESEANLKKLVLENRNAQTIQQPRVERIESQLQKLVADHERAVIRQRQVVSEMENRLSNIKETQAIVPPIRSLEPVGTSGKLIVAVAGILGLMLGIFAAFFTEFMDKVRRQQQP